MAFRVPQQTEAERDDYLLDCFYDAGFIAALLERRYSVISGRKGSGKTAVARYLENKYQDFSIDVAQRISIRSLSLNSGERRADRLNTLLFFLVIKAVQRLIISDVLSQESRQYWTDFLNQNGLQLVQDYEAFVEMRRKENTGFSLKGILKMLGFGAEAKFKDESEAEYGKAQISNEPHTLLTALRTSLPDDKRMLIFIDDISDYLDESSDGELAEDIALIKSLLLSLDDFNATCIDAGKNFQFVSLVRNDLFEFMEGSNVNKLVSNSLELKWTEKSFAGLLIRRLPFYQDGVEGALADPIVSIKKWFPDEVFADALQTFNTGRHGSNFYAYMAAISFNRPRDFLKFCYAMRERLSTKHPATIENIEAAEIEYSDYLMKELRDELYLASRVFKFNLDADGLNRLTDILAQKDGFNAAHLRSELVQYFGDSTKIGKKKTEFFINEMWRYGIIGFQRHQDKVIQFKYLSNNAPLIMDKIKEYTFYLHRGLWWFAQKRRKKRSE